MKYNANEIFKHYGIDVEKAKKDLANTTISIHCWQLDDVSGFESKGNLTGGIQSTGDYIGKARNFSELTSDLDKALMHIPGKKKINLHAIYQAQDVVDRRFITPHQFEPWVKYAKERALGLGVTGVEKDDIEIKAHAIYSTVNEIGKFECSNQDINKLQQNICWSAKSNFVDIPTDCPQRDERMGWTGDIGLFSETACYNFDVKRFLEKWLKDMRVEQNKGGGFPNIIPSHGYGFPLTMPHVACDYWGDACIFVPLALYYQTGDIKLLEDNYEMMKKYSKACLGWANMLSFGKHRYIWHTLNMIHFGDWVVPGVDSMAEWQKRHKWTATCSLANTSRLLSKIAKILGKEEDSIYYNDLFLKVSDAFESILTDGAGKIKYEFETAYVLSLAHGMFKEENKENALNNLIKIIEKDDYTVHTGFPGTPFILFALADNGREDIAYKMLLNEKCPGWLFEVKAGGTTTWERWDALKADGSLNFANEDGTGGMVSFNHYALGAVGNFLYTRVLGLEALTGGYETFRFKPILGGDLKYAKGETKTPYGIIKAEWKIDNKKLTMSISAPFGTSGEITLPNGKVENIGSGDYSFSVDL